MKTRTQLVVGSLVLVAMGAFCAWKLRVTTDVTEFLALVGGRQQAELSRQLARSDLTRTMVLSVGGGDEAAVLDAAGQLAAALREHPEVSWVREGITPGTERAFYDLYYPRRFLFLSDRPSEELPDRFSDEGLHAAAAEVKRQLSLPTGTFIKRTVPGDPFLAFSGQLRRLKEAGGKGLEVVDGRFMAEGHAIVFLATKHSAFDTTTQGPLLDAIEQTFAELNPQGTLRLEQSGVNRVARDSERSIKADITRISVVSTLGIIILFLTLFRSPRFIPLGLLPLAAGVLTATTTSLLLFGQVHGITLAFGCSLIGVCIDYPVHVFNHHSLDPEPGQAVRRVWPGLLLGALTTVAGFLGLLWTSFPGVREIAVFSSSGVLAALFATRIISAPLLPAAASARPLQTALAARLAAGLSALRARPRLALIPPALALVVCVIGLPRLTWLDDPKALYEQNPTLHAEQVAVRNRVSRVDGARFVVAVGKDTEAALQNNDAVFHRLKAEQRAGTLEGFRSLHSFLWSAALQEENFLVLHDQPQLVDRTLAIFAEHGFRREAFEPFRESFLSEVPEHLTIEDLEASPAGHLVRSFSVELEGGVGVLTYLRGVQDGLRLQEALADVPGVVYLDQNLVLGGAYRGYREEVLELIAVGLVAVFLLVLARYRRSRATLAAFLPAVLAGATTLAILALAGVTLHLLHVTSLLMVLSIGADYGIFLAESRRHPGGEGATVLSIGVACATTVLAFGLLALSSAPVLRAIGLTIGLGVVLSLLLAPAAMALAKEELHEA